MPEIKRVKLVGRSLHLDGICADTKLMVSWMVGKRDYRTASIFMNDLASRLSGRVQLTTDGHNVYLNVVDEGFGLDVDYAMLIKVYGGSNEKKLRSVTAPRNM